LPLIVEIAKVFESKKMILLDQNDYNKFLEDLAMLVIERAKTQGQELELDQAKDLVFQFIHQSYQKHET